MLNTGASVINIMHTCMLGVAESNWLERKQPIHIPCPSYMFSKGATLEHFLSNVLEKQAPFERFPVKLRATLQSPNGNLWTGLDEELTLDMMASSFLHGGNFTLINLFDT